MMWISLCTILMLILFIKKIFHLKILINGIWFSQDGSVPKCAVENLVQLSNQIKQSGYRKNYQIIFWTDKSKLSLEVKKIFIKHGIRIKDYREVHLNDEISRTAMQWIRELLILGNHNNRLYYVLASDIFRLYLLCKELPSNYHAPYALYIDCNDISINQIPHPYAFRKLKNVAFHFVEFDYHSHDIFAELIPDAKMDRYLLTNDIIATFNKKTNAFLPDFFKIFCANLKNPSSGLINFLKTTSQTIPVIDDDLVRIIIFSTTHIVNSLYLVNSTTSQVCLLSYFDDQLEMITAREVEDIKHFVDFTRHYNNGYTYFQRNINLENANNESQEVDGLRQQWASLFIKRYQLRDTLDWTSQK